MRRAPAGERFDELTPWARDGALQGRVLATVRGVPPNGWCLDVGGGAGRLAAAGSKVRADLSWLSVDVVPPTALIGQNDHRAQGICADAVALPFAGRSISWISYRSSLHYIGLEPGLREAARVAIVGGQLIVLAKVADQFESCFDWYLRLHDARSVVRREVHLFPEIVAQIEAAGFSICRKTLFYRWAEYELASWLNRGNSLAPAQLEELSAVLRDSREAIAADGSRVLYEEDGRVFNRMQWLFVEAKM
jgi:hypothetical protein